MPLSEHEQHMLEQMEQALSAEDPKFASHMQGSTTRSIVRRRYAVGALAVVVGLGLVLVGVNTSMWIGGVGFAVMVAGVAYALTPPRQRSPRLGTVGDDGTVRPPAPKRPVGGPRRQGTPSSGTFMQRLEQRWERRRHER